jgi:hypothetical protein
MTGQARDAATSLGGEQRPAGGDPGGQSAASMGERPARDADPLPSDPTYPFPFPGTRVEEWTTAHTVGKDALRGGIPRPQKNVGLDGRRLPFRCPMCGAEVTTATCGICGSGPLEDFNEV